MLPGPVFNAELLTTARRTRFYLVRFIYGSILLFFVWQNDPARQPWYRDQDLGGMSVEELARVGRWLFITFVAIQSIAVLLLTPALVAGVIADERQRKTLHYLLASRLTSAEIVLGKLAARMVHLGVFVAVGLPVTSLLSLFGGVDPVFVVLMFAATLSSMSFVAAVAILVSSQARRSREAISLVYLIELFWFFGPSFIALLMPLAGPAWLRTYEWIRPVNQWIAPSSPFYLITTLGIRGRVPQARVLLEAFLWMMGLQLVYGLLFVMLAVVRLRPAARNEGGGRGRGWQALLQRKGRIFRRPGCGDNPMMWKERYVSRTSISTKLVTVIVAGLAMAGLVYLTYVYARPAFAELIQNGYGPTSPGSARWDFHYFVRGMGTLIYVLWVLAVASTASASVTSEREGDTWVSLLTSPLSGEEILRAKIIGALWGVRWLGLLLLTFWLTGVAAGSVHPLGFVAAVLESVVFLWFAAALGTYYSLRSKNSGRALLATIGTLIFVNGGYLMCCIPFSIREGQLMLSGVTPMLVGSSLVSYNEVRDFFTPGHSVQRFAGDMLQMCVLGTLFYLGAAASLTGLAFHRFDPEADRPRPGRAGGVEKDALDLDETGVGDEKEGPGGQDAVEVPDR